MSGFAWATAALADSSAAAAAIEIKNLMTSPSHSLTGPGNRIAQPGGPPRVCGLMAPLACSA